MTGDPDQRARRAPDPMDPGLRREERGRDLARGVVAFARRAPRRLLDLLLPPTCPVTGERVQAPGLLSASGWARLSFIDDPVCARCCAPFAHDYGDGAECAACIAAPPAFERARAAIAYDETAHALVTAFKYADRTELAPLLAGFLARAGAALLRPETILVPAPLHRRRLLARRYNQAGLLAAALAERAGLAVIHDALVRVRATPPQTRLSAEGRRRNVAGAFAARPSRAAALAGRPVVLIDDVMTTGATLSACARALKRAGAARVDALALARTMRGGIDVI